MRIPSFLVTNKRAVARVECTAVPNLMIIVGPNGCGKSTLLNEIRNSGGNSNGILYVAPHRTMQRQVVQLRHLLNQDFRMDELLTRSDAPSYEGVAMVAGGRDAWSVDNTSNYLKHGMCQIDVGRKDAISAHYDQDREILRDAIPDVWEPFRALTKSLLPHLEFLCIDTSNKNSIRCLWRVHGTTTEVDLDELSSGEKSIIQMFYPLVEHRIREMLDQIQGRATTSRTDLCILIDEPELHLHPNLQMKVLDYLRLLAADENTQIIVASHSPTIIEHASFDELYLLRPVELVADGENQLVPIADDDERLNALRDLFGGTSNLTAMQPVIIAEGIGDEKARHVVGTRKLFRALSDKFDGATVIAAGGKKECFNLQASLAPILSAFGRNLKVYALVDQDVGTPPTLPEGVFLLPVSTVENLLVDPEVLWKAMEAVAEQTTLRSTADVTNAIDTIMDEMEADEIERRVHKALGYEGFRPERPLGDIARQLEEFIARLQTKYTAEEIARLQEEAATAVADIKRNVKRREFYDGKKLLDLFFQRHLSQTGLKKTIFLFHAAKEARGRGSVSRFFTDMFDRLLGRA